MIDINQAKKLIHTRIEDVALHYWYTDVSSSMTTLQRPLELSAFSISLYV